MELTMTLLLKEDSHVGNDDMMIMLYMFKFRLLCYCLEWMHAVEYGEVIFYSDEWLFKVNKTCPKENPWGKAKYLRAEHDPVLHW